MATALPRTGNFLDALSFDPIQGHGHLYKAGFFPLNQNLDYDYPVFKSIFEFPVLVSFLFLATILFFAKRLFLKYRLVSFSIFWFFLTLLPESSLLPIKDVIYEHRLYLPMVGYSMFLVSGMYYLIGEEYVSRWW